jgi:hypothetical protein
LVPAAEVNAIEVLLPKQCGHCGENLPPESGKMTIVVPGFQTRQ